jgi:hypothetical protein
MACRAAQAPRRPASGPSRARSQALTLALSRTTPRRKLVNDSTDLRYGTSLGMICNRAGDRVVIRRPPPSLPARCSVRSRTHLDIFQCLFVQLDQHCPRVRDDVQASQASRHLHGRRDGREARQASCSRRKARRDAKGVRHHGTQQRHSKTDARPPLAAILVHAVRAHCARTRTSCARTIGRACVQGRPPNGRQQPRGLRAP